MPRRRRVFCQTANKLVPLSVKVPQDLKIRIDSVKQSVKDLDITLAFNVSKICCDTLETAVVQGEKELSALQGSKPTQRKGRRLASV